MDATQIVVATIAAIATIVASGSVGKSATAWFTSRRNNRRNRIAFLEREVEVERTDRRRFQEYAARLRRQMIEHGIPEQDIYPWPATAQLRERAP